MDCQKIHNRLRQQDCASICVICEGTVIAGCTFRLHPTVKWIELLLLGVKAGQKKKGLGSAALSKLKEYAREHNYAKIVAYADLRALGFFYKQEFKDIEKGDPEHKPVTNLIHRCDRSRLMQWVSPDAAPVFKVYREPSIVTSCEHGEKTDAT